jgi:plasmid stabilization system protein ParE
MGRCTRFSGEEAVTRKLVLRLDAKLDLEEALDWYEQKRAGLGKDFVAAVGDAMDNLRREPDRGIAVFNQLRRANVKRFPYGIFYLVEPDRIVVVGVLHARSSPKAWKSRLK